MFLFLMMSLFVCLVITPNLLAQEEFSPPGELVDVGGYKMHLLVEGKEHSGPTVIFFHGAGDIALHWNLVLPQVGHFATAVAFDQNGEGWSEHGHGAALNQQVYDSYQALKNGGYEGPYIVVGHSLGGILANLFTVAYPDEVTGVILVDATHPDVVLKVYDSENKKMVWKRMRERADQEIPPIKTKGLSEAKKTKYFQAKKDFGDQLSLFKEQDKKRFNWIYNVRPWSYVPGQGNSYESEILQEMYKNRSQYMIGDIPLIVITGGKKPLPEGDENWSSKELKNHSEKLQKDLLSISTQSKQIIAKHSGHQVHLEEPEVIVSAIREFFQ